VEGRSNQIKKYKKEGFAVLSGAMVLAFTGFALPLQNFLDLSAGYLLGIVPIALHFLHGHLIKDLETGKFIKVFYSGTILKLLFILAVYIFLLTATKIEQISFTLSFIISYIFHSVNEVIFLNHKLTN